MNLKTDNFILTTSTQVQSVLESIEKLDYEITLIHIVSVIHNSVLVQNLKLALQRKLPNAEIILLKHKDKSQTNLIVYSLEQNTQDEHLSDELLNALHVENTQVIQELKSCKKELLSKYFIDNLTQLPNIYQLRKDLQERENYTLVNIAIDNFITINNFYGSIVGDYLIEKISSFLQELLKNKLYRISGTEFIFFLDKDLSFYDLKEYLTSLYKDIKNISIYYQENKIDVGLTLASCVHSEQKNIFSKVSMALKYAKDKKLPFWIYEDRMKFEDEYARNLQTANTVRYAVENSKIVPYFQPIVNNITEKIEKYECLARLIDENDNVISPILFIPIAKNIKVYNLITKMIIDKSFAIFEKNEFSFSINLSMEDIVNSDMFEFIIQKLKMSPASSRVIFEILESEAIQDFDKIVRFIKEIKRYGAKIAIDDFGSGYSNFSYILKMDVDFLKIDGSLIENIDTDSNSFLVVETIVNFAHKLKIKTIAEYVHSSTVMDKVKEMKIDYSQGFHIDKPLVSL